MEHYNNLYNKKVNAKRNGVNISNFYVLSIFMCLSIATYFIKIQFINENQFYFSMSVVLDTFALVAVISSLIYFKVTKDRFLLFISIAYLIVFANGIFNAFTQMKFLEYNLTIYSLFRISIIVILISGCIYEVVTYKNLVINKVQNTFYCSIISSIILILSVQIGSFFQREIFEKNFFIGIVAYIMPFISMNIQFAKEVNRSNQLEKNYIELKDKFKKFYETVEESHNLILFISKEGAIEHTNPCCKNIFKSDNLIGKNIFQDDELRIFKPSLESIQNEFKVRNKWVGEIEYCYSDEFKRRYKGSIFAIKNKSEYVENYIAIMEDITERSKIEAKLKKSEKKLREIMENMCDMMFKIDCNGIIQYVSTSYCKVMGVNYKDFKGKNICDFIHSSDLHKFKYGLIKTKISLEDERIEYRLKVSNDEYIWVEGIQNIILDNDKNIVGWVITNRDIMFRKKMEKALKESEKKYRDFFNICTDYIYVLDVKTGKVIDANLKVLNTFGLNLSELKSKNTMYSIGREAYNVCKRNYKRILKGEEVKEVQVLTKDKDGNQLDLEVNYTPIYDKGKLTNILCLGRDISHRKKIIELENNHQKDRKKLIEAIEYDKIKTEFFANISHELRTPINVIFSALQVIDVSKEKHANSYHYNKYTKIMKQNCYRLLRLVNNIIDITKIDSGYFNVELTNNDIVKIVEDITISVVAYAENKGLNVTFDTQVEEKIIACDPDKIERIIINLLSNAIKFTPYGGNILVNIKQEEGGVCIIVKDDGRGIPEEKLDVIFDRFRQVDKSLARDHEGSGIGLSLVRSLVELHGGRVNVKSRLMEGSEFIIELPDRIIEQENKLLYSNEIKQASIERITIEFSDIYEI